MNKEEKIKLLEDFAEYCHQFYNGCQKREDRYDEWEYCYKNEVINMVEGFINSNNHNEREE